MSKRKAQAAAYIPPDLCEEILYRLPSKDLINFKLVCKDWLRLISSSGFIEKHLERSKATCNYSKIVIPSESTIEILDYANKTSKKINSEYPDILGSCDGLVLYYFKGRIAAFNPCTGDSVMSVPNQSICDDIKRRWRLVCSWFGLHPSTGEYVLVIAIFLSNEQTIIFKVYSLSPNNMNIICSSTLKLDTDSWMLGYQKLATFWNGKLHCLPVDLRSEYPEVILVYDFKMNEVTKMSPPAECYQTLGVVDGCLSALLFKKKQVWVMKEYGVEKSWTKYADVEGIEDGDIWSPFGFCPWREDNTSDVELLRVCKYCFREREIKILKTYYFTTRMPGEEAVACIDSLVSPTLQLNWSKEDE